MSREVDLKRTFIYFSFKNIMNSFNNSNFCPRQNPKQNNFTIEHYGRRTPEKLCKDNGGVLSEADDGSGNFPLICTRKNYTGTLQYSAWDYKPNKGEIKFSWEDGKNYVCTEKLGGSCLTDKIHVYSYDKGSQRAYFMKNDKPVVVKSTTKPRDSDKNYNSNNPIPRLLSLHTST